MGQGARDLAGSRADAPIGQQPQKIASLACAGKSGSGDERSGPGEHGLAGWQTAVK